MIDFAKQRRRSRLEAWMLATSADANHRVQGDRKTAEIGSMSGTIVEVGPGPGINLRYYAPGVRVIAIEPNVAMHERLAQQAAEHDVDLEIRTIRGESIDVGDGEADGVVATLLLCGVDDPAAVVREVHRILAPGGRYFFTEHVRAPDATWTRRIQRVVRRPHHWLFNGCRTDQDTATILSDGPFASVEIDEYDRGPAGLYVRHGLIGTAVKAG